MKEIINFIIQQKEEVIYLLTIIYEVLSRLIPTTYDWSIINKIINVIELLLPNKRKSAIANSRHLVAKKQAYKEVVQIIEKLKSEKVEINGIKGLNDEDNGTKWKQTTE